jgi:5'-3' exonuclease
MGVPGLIGVIERVCGQSEAKRTIDGGALRVLRNAEGGKGVLAVDAMNLLFYLAGLEDGRGLESELEAFCSVLRDSDIRAACVFDSNRLSKMRKARASVRRRQRNEALSELERVARTPSIASYADCRRQKLLRSRTIHVTPDEVRAAQLMLSKSGVCTVFMAPDEADAVCVDLVTKGTAFACLSNDSDMFVQGCKRVLRMYRPMEDGRGTFELWETQMVYSEFGMTLGKFQEICKRVVSRPGRAGHEALYGALMGVHQSVASSPSDDEMIWPRGERLPLRSFA